MLVGFLFFPSFQNVTYCLSPNNCMHRIYLFTWEISSSPFHSANLFQVGKKKNNWRVELLEAWAISILWLLFVSVATDSLSQLHIFFNGTHTHTGDDSIVIRNLFLFFFRMDLRTLKRENHLPFRKTTCNSAFRFKRENCHPRPLDVSLSALLSLLFH